MLTYSEAERVSAVRDLQIIDTGPEPEYDRLVRIVRHLAKATEAHMCFIDDRHSYIKALEGANFPRKVLRERSICEAVVSEGGPIVIPDLASDPLPKRRAVWEEFGLRSYVGVPIVMPEGHTVGVVAAMSDSVGVCSDRRLDALQDLAQIASRELVIRKLSRGGAGPHAGLFAPMTASSTDARRAVTENHVNALRSISDGIVGFRRDGSINFVNPAAERILGRSAETMLGSTFGDAMRCPDPDGVDRACPVSSCIQDGSDRFVPSARFRCRDASVRVEFVVSPLLSNGRPTGAFVVFRETAGLAPTNGVELRRSLREVTRLKEQIARLEARSKALEASRRSLSSLDSVERPDFAQLTSALRHEKDDQIRRARALVDGWTKRPPGFGTQTEVAAEKQGLTGADPTGDQRKLTRIERWLAEEVSREGSVAAPSKPYRLGSS